MKNKFKFVVCLIILSVLCISVNAIEITKYTPSASCGETQFEVLNQADYNYLVYNECQEWKFPRILTNIKTTFVNNNLNAKVIPINIAEMNQNNTPEDYSDDYPAKTIMINSVDVIPEWNPDTKQLSWTFYFDTANADIILYYEINGNAGKWGLEILDWEFSNVNNYIRLKNQIFSGGGFVDFDCSDITATRGCSFLDNEENEFSKLYFDYPENEGETYYDGLVWYSQSGQNHNLYQDLGRGEEIILDPTITSELIGASGFINDDDKPQCAFVDANMFCVGKFDTKALKLVTATLPLLTDWTLADWNFLPVPDSAVFHPIMTSSEDNIYMSYLWATNVTDRNVVLTTANSNYLTIGSWDTVYTSGAGSKKQNGTLDVNSEGWVVSAYGLETGPTHYMGWCEDCTAQENVSDIHTFTIPRVQGNILTGLFVDDDMYVVLLAESCSLGTYDRSTGTINSGSIGNRTFNCSAGGLQVANDRLYVTYSNATTDIGYISYIDTDKNIADVSLWSTPVVITANHPLSYSLAFVDSETSDDFNSLVIAYSEGDSDTFDYNRFVGYKKFSTETNTITSAFTIVDENVEDYSESKNTDSYYDSTRNNVYILYSDQNSNNYNPGAYISIISVGISGYLNTDFNYTAGGLTDLNIFYSFYNDSTSTDVNDFTYQWDVNSALFSINEDSNRSLTLGNDYNICLLVTGQAFDGNTISNQECQTISVNYGSLTMSFIDENTSIGLPNVTANFNGTDYDADADGTISVSLVGISKGLYTISASDGTHPERTFTYDLNVASVLDENVILLKTTKGQNIEFKFYGNDETTLLGDANISIRNRTADKYAYIKATTNSSGEATFFLNPEDYAYDFEIEDNTGNFTYSSGIITVRRPKNIIDLNIIVPFNIVRSGLVSGFVNSLSADINFSVFTNIVTPYEFLIDANSGLYYITSGSFSLNGDENLVVYQPYLVPVAVDDGIEVSVYTIDNQNNRKSLPGVLIELYTAIEGVDTLVASKISDGSGKAVMHFALNKPYTLKAYYEGEEKLSITIENPASNLFLYIETGTFEEFEAMGLVQVIWYYNTSNLIPTAGFVTMLQTIIPIATTVGDVNITIYQGDLLVDTNGFTLNTSDDTNITYDVNITGLNQYLPLVVTITIYDTSGNILLETSGNYSFVDDDTWQKTIEYAKTGFGLLATTLIIVILCIYLMGLLSPQRMGQDNNWLFILPLIILGLGSFLGLIDMIGWFLASLFAISIAIWRVRE